MSDAELEAAVDARDMAALTEAVAARFALPKEPTVADETNLLDIKWLTVAEVAVVVRVSKMTVYRLVNSGELPAIRVGRSFRVAEGDVVAYLKGRFDEAARGRQAGRRDG